MDDTFQEALVGPLAEWTHMQLAVVGFDKRLD